MTNGAARLFHQKGSTEISDPIVTGLAHLELDALSSSTSGSRFTALGQRPEEAAQAARDGRDAIVASFDVIKTSPVRGWI